MKPHLVDFSRSIRLFISIGMILTLSAGCATTVSQMQPNDPLAPDRGFVIVRIMNNTAQLSTFFSSWQGLNVLDQAGQQFLLTPTKADVKSTQIFLGQLPAGTYKLQRLGSSSSGAMTVSTSAEIGDKLGSFLIKAGDLTDLGTVIYQPVGKDHFVFIRSAIEAESREFLNQNFPVIAGALRGHSVHLWNDSVDNTAPVAGERGKGSLPLLDKLIQVIAEAGSRQHQYLAWDQVKNNRDALRLAKLNSFSFNSLRQLSTGEIFAGSSLGQVVVRDSSRKWGQIDVGTNREITAIKPLDPQRIIVGGEEGLLMSTENGGKSWVRVPPPGNLGVVTIIEKLDNRWFVAGLRDNKLSVYESSGQIGTNWRLVKEIPVENITYSSPEYSALVEGNRLLLFVPSNQIYAFDGGTNSWSQWEVPYTYRAIYPIGGGDLVGSAAWGTQRSVFTKKAIFLSRNYGKSWSMMKADRLADHPAFKNKDEGYAIQLVIGALSGSTKLVKTIDSGETWNDVAELPTIATGLFLDRIGGRLHYLSSARVYALSDDSKTWEVVR